MMRDLSFFIVLFFCLLNLPRRADGQVGAGNSSLCEASPLSCSHHCVESLDEGDLSVWCSCYPRGRCPVAKFDIFFVLDASEEVSEEQWRQQTNLVNLYARMYPLGADGVQISVMSFNNETTKVMNFRQSNMRVINRVTQKQAYPGGFGKSDLASAVIYAVRYRLKRVHGRRMDVPLVVVVVTASPSVSDERNNRIAKKRLTRICDHVFMLGVGKNVNRSQLLDFTDSKPGRIALVNTHSSLNHRFLDKFGFCVDTEKGERLELEADGENCDIDECLNKSNGGCSHVCKNTVGSYKCSCPDGYFLSSEDGHTCMRDRCDDDPCEHLCIGDKLTGDYTCECQPGYTLHDDLHSCVDVNECDTDNGGCEQGCVNTLGSYHCLCEHGFLRDTDNKKCVISCYTCTNALSNDECNNLQVCQDNQASCFTTVRTNDNVTRISKGCQQQLACINNFIQNTKSGVSGEEQCNKYGISSKCECCCFESACNHQECKFYENIPRCHKLARDDVVYWGEEEDDEGGIKAGGMVGVDCPSGYEESRGSSSSHYLTCLYDPNSNSSDWNRPTHYLDICKDIDECKRNDGGCNEPSQCINFPGGYECRCPPHLTPDIGYEMVDERNCDLNECSNVSGVVTGCSHQCLNLIGSYECACPDDMVLSRDSKTCRDSLCKGEANGGCEDRCDDVDHSIICSCPSPGLVKLPQDNYTCSIDLCYYDNGNCSHTCQPEEFGVNCTCPEGWQLSDEDGLTCVDPSLVLFNECEENNGGCSHFCTDLPRDYRCECPEGWYLEQHSDRLCVESDPCTPNPCNSGRCVRTGETDFFCHCEEHQRLDEDDPLTCVPRPAEADCVESYIPIGHSCMRQISDRTLGYYQSRDVCAREGARLAVMNDLGTARAVRDQFDEPYWIGLHYDPEADMWVNSDGSNHTLDGWERGQPTEGNGSCGHVVFNVKRDHCDQPKHFVCEKVRRSPFIMFPTLWSGGGTAKLYMATGSDVTTLIFPEPIKNIHAWHCSVERLEENEFRFSQSDDQKGGGKGKCEFIIELFKRPFPPSAVSFRQDE